MESIENSQELINKLFNLFITKEYGDLIYHSEVEKILGFDRSLNKYGIYVKQAKDRLVEHSKILKAIPGIGWQVLKPQQVSSFVYRQYIKKTLKIFDYSQNILFYLNKTGFSKDRLNEFQDVEELNDALKLKTQSIIQSSKYYSRIDYYNSLKD